LTERSKKLEVRRIGHCGAAGYACQDYATPNNDPHHLEVEELSMKNEPPIKKAVQSTARPVTPLNFVESL